jgi:Protein of unknown function (DUF1580)
MIDIHHEKLVSLKYACTLIPGRSSEAISRATVWRWALTGRRGVRLETVLLGDRFTSVEAIGRFVAKLNDTAPTAKPAARSREAERTARILIEEGL